MQYFCNIGKQCKQYDQYWFTNKKDNTKESYKKKQCIVKLIFFPNFTMRLFASYKIDLQIEDQLKALQF